MITLLLYFELSGQKLCQKTKQRLRHQGMKAEAVEAEAIQKLSLPHPWLDQIILFLIFKFKFIDFAKTKFKFIDFAKVKFKFINNSCAD